MDIMIAVGISNTAIINLHVNYVITIYVLVSHFELDCGSKLKTNMCRTYGCGCKLTNVARSSFHGDRVFRVFRQN